MRFQHHDRAAKPPAHPSTDQRPACSFCPQDACSEVTWPDGDVSFLCGSHERWLLRAQMELDGLLVPA